MVSLLRSFVVIFLFCVFKEKFENEVRKLFFGEKKCFAGRIMKISIKGKKNFVKEIEFLKKSNDEKGHVFELLFSDELYNFVRRSEKKGSIFRHKSFNVLFRRVK